MTRHPSYDKQEHSVIILESHSIASGSSGKGGGLLARSAEPECLAQPSFELHQELADLHNGWQRWGYRRLTCADCTMDTSMSSVSDCAAIFPDGQTGNEANIIPQSLDWIHTKSVTSYNLVGSERDSAQCDTFNFTLAFFDLACAHGARLLGGRASKIKPNVDCNLEILVHYMEEAKSKPEVIQATDVVIASGPWSSKILPEASVSGARCHSIVLRPQKPLTSNLLFMDIVYTSQGEKRHLTPEVYPRPGGTVYACEAADPSFELPPSSADVVVSPEACDRIQDAISAVSQSLKEAEYETRQVCYQPIVIFEGKRRKLVGPFIGRASIPGAYLACGHDSWGISNAPATGKALSELVFDGISLSIDIDSLSISNVMARARG